MFSPSRPSLDMSLINSASLERSGGDLGVGQRWWWKQLTIYTPGGIETGDRHNEEGQALLVTQLCHLQSCNIKYTKMKETQYLAHRGTHGALATSFKFSLTQRNTVDGKVVPVQWLNMRHAC